MWVLKLHPVRGTDFKDLNMQGYRAASPYLDVHVVLRHVDEGGQALAEPHGDVPVHVDGEGLEALLQAAHGVVLEGAGVFTQVHATHLRQAEAAHRNEP